MEIPRTAEPRPEARAEVRDESARPVPCTFADSPLEVNVDRLRFIGPDGAALPAQIVDLLSRVQPQAGARRLAYLCDLRDEVAGVLHARGYVAGVTIPPQEITTGEVRLIVILARLSDVRISGDPGPHRRALEARIERLKTLPALNTREVERVLLGANDTPGLRVAMNLHSAGTAPGEMIGELAVRYTPFAVIANLQNSGSRTIGRESGVARLEYYGLTGHADRTFLGLSSTLDVDEQQVLQLGHYMATDAGTSFGLRFSHAWSRPEIGLLSLRSRSIIGGLDISTPLVRTVRATVDLGGGLELIEQRVRLKNGGGSLPVTRDKLRVAYLRLSGSVRQPRFNAPDSWGLGGSIELRQGLDILGATERGVITGAGYAPSRFEGDPSATVLRGGASGFVTVTPAISLSATVQGQWASDALLSFEEFSVGNLTIGRGYDPGVTGGDKALGARIEPRVQLPLKSSLGVEAFGFYDVVRVWNDDSLSTEDGRSLASWGGGLRATLPGRMSLEAMYARPIDSELRLPGARRAPDRLLLSLTVRFSPR